MVMQNRPPTRRQDQTAIWRVCESLDRALDLTYVAHIDRAHLHPDRRRHALDRAELADPRGYARIPNNRRSPHARRDLFEQFQPFAAQAVFERKETGGVAARPRQAVDVPGTDRIDDDREHDRHGASRL